MNDFEIPKIPKIFVPKSIIKTSSESQRSRKVSKSSLKSSETENVVKNKDNSSQKPTERETTNRGINTVSLPPPPQLCPSCSQILLSYFVPLQQYVNDVVQIARGEHQTSNTSLPILSNSDVSTPQTLNQNFIERTERNDSNNEYKGTESKRRTESQTFDNNSSYDSNAYENQNYIRNEFNYENKDHKRNESQNYSNDSNEERDDNHNQSEHQSGEQTHNWDSDQSVRRFDETERQQHFGVNASNDSQRHEDNTTYADRSQSQPNSWTQDNTCDNSEGEQQSSTNTESYEERKDQTKGQWVDRNMGNEEERTERTGDISPFAFVTIAYNNLSATNAIILANSLLLTNNKTMNYSESNGNKRSIEIPFIILIGGSIDPILKDAIYMIFDEVISQPMDVRVALLSDQSFGVQQFKLQLWKELQKFEKCLYLESSTLVVGRVTNLFEECQELSACVDWLFPDNFNCSVFVFEPSLTTYEQILSFAIFHQKCSAQKDEGVAETLDEMTLLNQFFGPKWQRISFVYNFVKNDAIYTQIPAFMKFGDSIKIVNFGHMMSQSGGLGNQSGMSSVQPWHIMFDLMVCSQQDVIKAMPIDNYSKFYLNCFIQRLWPIIQSPLTPLLVTKYGIGRREWSIFDLIRLLTNESGIETDDHMFTQTPLTFRRIKSTAEKIAQYDGLDVNEDEDLIDDEMPRLSLNDNAESEPKDIDSGLDSNSEQTIDVIVKKTEEEVLLDQQQQGERSKKEWEAGRIDWMGAHGSDKIINRLKKMIRND